MGAAIGIARQNQVEVYLLPYGRQLQQINHPEPVSGVIFTPRREILIWGGSTVQLKRWWGNVYEEACGRLTRNLSNEEWRTNFGSEPYHSTCLNLLVGTTRTAR